MSVARLASVLARLPGRASLTGTAAVAVDFRHTRTGCVTAVPAGAFSLAPGEYDVTFGGAHRTLVLADGARSRFDPDPAWTIDFDVALRTTGTGTVLSVRGNGAGAHSMRLRCDNASASATKIALDLDASPEFAVEVAITVLDLDRPATIVAIPDERVDAAREAYTAGPAWRTES